MNLFQDDIKKEFERINKKIERGEELTLEDIKTILLAELKEEDLYESK